MFNLAIECSGVAGSVALCDGQELLAKVRLPVDLGSVQSLAATIDELLSRFVPAPPRRVTLISITTGPGSFTGLRVGLATAQMLAFAWKIPVAPVDTLAAIAHGACGNYMPESPAQPQLESSLGPIIVVPILNAYRKQVFAGAWRLDTGKGRGVEQECRQRLPDLTPIAPSQVLDASKWQTQPWRALAPLNSRSSQSNGCGETVDSHKTPVRLDTHPPAAKELTSARVLVCGPGLRTYLPTPQNTIAVADQELWEPDASIVAQLGWNIFQRDGTVSAAELRPNYVRASAAEEQAR